MIDAELVTRKILLITRDLEALGPIATKDRTSYLESRTDEILVERYLERLIGRMIDINYHLITETGHPPPPDYHASFTQLAEQGILDHEFAPRIARCAGLRNRIVHEYNELDPAKVFDALQAAVRDIPEYLAKVNKYITAR
jgi:uncharacterized protein YutE (UPF0331/DUF86 family)